MQTELSRAEQWQQPTLPTANSVRAKQRGSGPGRARQAGRARQDMSGLARMVEEISREGAGQRNAYNVALHIGTKEIENVEMAKRKWAVSSRKAAGSGLQLSLSAEASGIPPCRKGAGKETGCPGDCFAFFAFIDELSITKLYFRLLFLLSCGLFFSFQGYDIELQPGNGLKCPATAAAVAAAGKSQATFSSCATFCPNKVFIAKIV